MSADVLLARLDGVMRSGSGWRARCPACGGKSRKVSICEAENGTTLLNCFGCHDTPGILAAIGLHLVDLFPARMEPASPAARAEARRAARETQWGAALGVLDREATIALLVAKDVYAGRTPGAADLARLGEAVHRIGAAREIFRVH